MTEPYEYCRACGFESYAYELLENGLIAPNYMICACCGMESGVDDDTVEHVRRYRQEWMLGNEQKKWGRTSISFVFRSWLIGHEKLGRAPFSFVLRNLQSRIAQYRDDLTTSPHWFDPREKPFHWNLEAQMKNIPEAFR